jgi:hypothetical protein
MDAYKRGAFLDKADRFNKDKPSDVPGANIVLAFTRLNSDVQHRTRCAQHGCEAAHEIVNCKWAETLCHGKICCFAAKIGGFGEDTRGG